jgi:hypothetical protein
MVFLLVIFIGSPYAAISQLKAGEPIVIGGPTALGSTGMTNMNIN